MKLYIIYSKTDSISEFVEQEKTKHIIITEPKHYDPTISKPAQINKTLYQMEKAAKVKYNAFSDYMKLRNIAGNEEEKEEETEVIPERERDNRNTNDELIPEINQEEIYPEATQLIHPSKKIRKTKSVKEKEMARRMKGQSSIATWKPDLYMKLRQQYD